MCHRCETQGRRRADGATALAGRRETGKPGGSGRVVGGSIGRTPNALPFNICQGTGVGGRLGKGESEDWEISLPSFLKPEPRQSGEYLPALSALVRLWVAVSFLVAAFGDFAAAKASTGSHSLDGLVAICGDGGVRYVRIEGLDGLGEQLPASDDCSCIACLCCAVEGAGLAVPYSPQTGVGLHASHSRLIIAFTPDALPVAAEQYWAASRGPPDLKEENQ